MLFYDQVQALNSETHAQWRIAPQASWAFAAKAHAVPLLAQEFAAAQADYAIAFAKDEAGTYMPVALLGLKAEQNLFVNAQGQWQQGAYIPAYVRRFPFAPAGEGDKMVVVMETSSGVVGPFAEGEPLFDKGQPTETLQRALGLVEAFHREAQGTQAFCRWLDEQQLLTPVTAEVRAGEQAAHRLDGMWVVNETKFNALADDEVLKLFKSGQLAWVYAHLMSLKNLSKYRLA
jgi:hypothetical protein